MTKETIIENLVIELVSQRNELVSETANMNWNEMSNITKRQALTDEIIRIDIQINMNIGLLSNK